MRSPGFDRLFPLVLFFAVFLCRGIGFSSAFAAPPVWTVDSLDSHLSFSGKDNGKIFSGEFKKFTPEIAFDRQDLAASSIKVIVDTASATTGDETYDRTLPGGEWFNVFQFPNAVFESAAIRYLGSDKAGVEGYEASGKLTILGVTQNIIFPFTLAVTNQSAHATGNLRLKRLDFGLGKTVDAKGDSISNDIIVRFDIRAHLK